MKTIEILEIKNLKLETTFEVESYKELEKWIEEIGFQDSCFSIKQGKKFSEVYVDEDFNVFYTECDKNKAYELALC
ncbi:TPA: hypothetical protein RTG66_001544 [Campylobacter jejuni]|nr:hypothetical protein [Campylobacter jejuni]